MNTAVLLGVLGPLMVVSSSWALMVRTFRRDPARLTSFMAAAFAVKMLFFAAYVTLAVAVFSVPTVPFGVAFAVSFIALYLAEAIGLRRLLASR
jgi:hypothetical protein